MPKLIDYNKEIEYDGFELEHEDVWYISVLGEYTTGNTLLNIYNSMTLRGILEVWEQVDKLPGYCGISYVLSKGNRRYYMDDYGGEYYETP